MLSGVVRVAMSMLGMCCCLCMGYGGIAVGAVQGGHDGFAFPALFGGCYVSPVMVWSDSSVVGARNI